MAQLNDSMLKPIFEVNAVSFNSSTETQSDALPETSSANILIQVLGTANCHIAIPKRSYTSDTATKTKSMPIPAWTPIVFKVTPGVKLSVIGNASSGTLFITQME